MLWALPLLLVAQAPPLELTWDVPEGCASRESIEALVSTLVTPVAPLKAHVTVQRTADGYELVLITDAGRRELKGAQCEEVTHGAALALAMLLEPSDEPLPPPRVTPPAPIVPAPPEPEPWTGAVRVGGVAELGSLPAASAGLRVTGVLAKGALVTELAAATYLPQRVGLLPTGTARVSLDVEVLVRGCWSPRLSALRPRLCGAIAAGPLRAVGSGVSLPRTGQALFAAAFLGAGAKFELPAHFSLVTQLDVGVPLVRSEIAVDGESSVFLSPWLVFRAEAAIQWQFP